MNDDPAAGRDPGSAADPAASKSPDAGVEIPPFDVALFDAGMTLIHPVRTVESIYVGLARRSGVPLEELLLQVRRRFRDLFERERRVMAEGLDGFRWSDEQDRAFWRRLCFAVAESIPALTDDPQAWYEQLYAHFGQVSTWQPFGDALQTLRSLRSRGVKLAVVSNWDSRLEGILEGLGIAPLVDAVLISAVCGHRKPGSRIFELALERMEARPETTIMVGDSLTDDIRGADGVGLTGVLLHRSSTSPPEGVLSIRALAELL